MVQSELHIHYIFFSSVYILCIPKCIYIAIISIFNNFRHSTKWEVLG